MKTSQHHLSDKQAARSQQLDESQLNYYQELALEAMLHSFVESRDENTTYNSDESRSYVLGYN